MNEFKPSSWAQHPKDLEKEYNAWDKAQTALPETPTEPEALSLSLVRRGVLDPNTGLPTGNSKQRHISAWTPSQTFQKNYDRIFRKEL
jgi:hypothetical protein